MISFLEGTLGSDCSRLGIKVANSTSSTTVDVGSHGETGLCTYFFSTNLTLFFIYEIEQYIYIYSF